MLHELTVDIDLLIYEIKNCIFSARYSKNKSKKVPRKLWIAKAIDLLFT